VMVFNYDSTLMSMIEDHIDADHESLFSFKTSANPTRYYYKALHGMYKLFYDLNIEVDMIDSREIEKIHDYKLAYFPYATMLDPLVEDVLLEYKGTLLLDEGFGLRSQNTWINPNKTSFDRLLNNTKWYERVYANNEKTLIYGNEVTCAPFKTKYLFGGQEIDGKGYLQQKDNIFLCGTSIGYSYYDYQEKGWLELINRIADSLDLQRNKDFGITGIKTQYLDCGEQQLLYIFNWSGYQQKINIKEKIVKELIGLVTIKQDEITMKHGDVACILLD